MPIDKLKDDPIVEALLEIRFATDELPEVVTGRLSDLGAWKTAKKIRLPAAEIPISMRESNPALRLQPTIEIQGADGIGAVRVGGNVLSLHFLQRYEGWEAVFPRLKNVIEQLFGALAGLAVTRLGLRYINAFTESRHFVRSVNDLALVVKLADATLTQPMNFAYFSKETERHLVVTRVSSRHFVAGKLPEGTSAVVDIDVSTPEGFNASTAGEISQWLDDAHNHEKLAFKRLLTSELFSKLKE